jgi:two-component system phosphate regulon response regulator PhoB
MEFTVLVVEDEPPQAEMLSYNLQKEGFRVLLASDGEEGLLMARESLPDVIVLDWMLPGLTGIEICRQLRGEAATREIPILMLTPRGEEEDRVQTIMSSSRSAHVKWWRVSRRCCVAPTPLR